MGDGYWNRDWANFAGAFRRERRPLGRRAFRGRGALLQVPISISTTIACTPAFPTTKTAGLDPTTYQLTFASIIPKQHLPGGRCRIFSSLQRTAGWSSPVARQAHNLKVVGSNPAPATNFKGLRTRKPFFFSNLGTFSPYGSLPPGGPQDPCNTLQLCATLGKVWKLWCTKSTCKGLKFKFGNREKGVGFDLPGGGSGSDGGEATVQALHAIPPSRFGCQDCHPNSYPQALYRGLLRR